MPQWKPRPGASCARASGEPIMTASAPHANALAMSPPLRMPPSAITFTYWPVSSMCCERAACTSAIAVACGTPMPEHAARRAGRARPDADEHAHRAGAHQVQAGRVAGAAADDARDRHLGDELLQVERLDRRGHVLGGDHRALDHEHVEAGVERDLVVLAHPLRRQRPGSDDALGLDLPHALGDSSALTGSS